MSWSVTGTGMVTSVGGNVADCVDAFVGGRTGNSPLHVFDHDRYSATRAYEIEDRPDGRDRAGRATRFLLRAVAEALGAAGPVEPDARVAVLVGTGLRELRSVELWWAGGADVELAGLHFADALQRGAGLTTAPTLPAPTTVCNACSASLFTLGLACDLLDQDEADVVVVAGVDVLTESMIGLLDRVNLAPPQAVRPFDRQRRGVLLGEGAAAVVLERTSTAHERGARDLATLRGVGLNCDAAHPTAPDHTGIAAVMRDAHRRAGVDPSDIDLLLVHGTGTALNDEAEARALLDVFGPAGPEALVSGLKAMTGHTSGASGLVGVVTAVECLRRDVVPPTPGLEELDPVAAALRFVDEAKSTPLHLAQVDAFGFGGVNAVAILEESS